MSSSVSLSRAWWVIRWDALMLKVKPSGAAVAQSITTDSLGRR